MSTVDDKWVQGIRQCQGYWACGTKKRENVGLSYIWTKTISSLGCPWAWAETRPIKAQLCLVEDPCDLANGARKLK